MRHDDETSLLEDLIDDVLGLWRERPIAMVLVHLAASAVLVVAVLVAVGVAVLP